MASGGAARAVVTSQVRNRTGTVFQVPVPGGRSAGFRSFRSSHFLLMKNLNAATKGSSMDQVAPGEAEAVRCGISGPRKLWNCRSRTRPRRPAARHRNAHRWIFRSNTRQHKGFESRAPSARGDCAAAGRPGYRGVRVVMHDSVRLILAMVGIALIAVILDRRAQK